MPKTESDQFVTLDRGENQARAIGQYALDMVQGRYAGPTGAVLAKTEQFHLDSVACGVAALACGANAPTVLRREALEYRIGKRGHSTFSSPDDGSAKQRDRKSRMSPFSGRPRSTDGVPMFGSTERVAPEKAVLACSSAVREFDANGTNFGYNPARRATAGEFGHNDFYPVAVAAAQLAGLGGRQLVVAMATLDEIRGRLAEVFALNKHRIDHVMHGAIASAAVYGAVLGATADQIESAIGLVVAHYVPFRAIRAGHQLSDSKGASAAISAEAAVTSLRRAMHGFVGPADVFRNPQALFCLFEPPAERDASPFDLNFATAGDDFAVMGMHFKLGLYEHQSAGAMHGLLTMIEEDPRLLDDDKELLDIRITIYEPAFSIIGDPAKRDPQTRQSADHSMVYIVATLLRKAYEDRRAGWDGQDGWRRLMLTPADYAEDDSALFHPLTRRLMQQIDFRAGGPEYDKRYPDGIPTTVELVHTKLGPLSSGLVMYPHGHARGDTEILPSLVDHKVRLLAGLGVENVDDLIARFSNLADKSPDEVANLYDFKIRGLEA
jgi:2-methylcitrate dehydratase